MTEAAIKRAKKQKFNRILLIISAVILAVTIVLWIVQFNITNSRAIPQLVEYYEPGEYVEIGDNFFFDATEHMNGYSIKVNSAKLYDYEKYLIDNGHNELLETLKKNGRDHSEYLVMLDVNIKNEDNKTGKVMVRKFTLYNNALYLMSDFEVWCEIDPYFKGYSSLMFQADTENKMHIPFTPSDYDFNTAGDEIERRLLEEDFYFCICEFPVRKMIRVPIENCVD